MQLRRCSARLAHLRPVDAAGVGVVERLGPVRLEGARRRARLLAALGAIARARSGQPAVGVRGREQVHDAGHGLHEPLLQPLPGLQDAVQLPVLPHIRRRLEVSGTRAVVQLLVRLAHGVQDDLGAREPDPRVGHGDLHVRLHGVGRGHAPVGGVVQHGHEGQARALQRLHGHGHLGHLHQAAGSLLHARATGPALDAHGQSVLQGVLESLEKQSGRVFTSQQELKDEQGLLW